MIRHHRLPIAAACAAVAALAAAIAAPFAPDVAAQPRPHGDRPVFAPSTECLACHNGLAGGDGEDVSIGASWRGTMMANSARDPYVQASVRREMIDHASRASEIEDECATCHAPASQRLAHADGRLGTLLSHVSPAAAGGPARDMLGSDGVTCTVCHQIAAGGLGSPDSYNGRFAIAPPPPGGNPRAFGPFAPDPGRRRIMHSVTGFEQEQAAHIRESALCATCHTLTTEALGPDGRVIGSLPEQMNYLEWRQSAFAAERRSCQSCHMPAARGPVRVSSVLGEDRDELARHTFLGGNAFMLRLLNRYRAELGVEASSSELEAVARATLQQLEHDTAQVAIEHASVSGDLVTADVVVRNLTGHKFPTGFPSRRAWLHVTVRDAAGRTLVESGGLRDSGAIDTDAGDARGTGFEPHHTEITDVRQIQIYEAIMGTPAGRPTTGLLQATQYLKDNRLLPRGFDKAGATAETRVIGGAAADEDFIGGADRVRYRLAAPGAAAIEVELLFQPIAYRWAQQVGRYDAPEPRRFLSYYASLSAASSHLVARASQALRVAP